MESESPASASERRAVPVNPLRQHALHRIVAGAAILLLCLVRSGGGAADILLTALAALLGASQLGLGIVDLCARPTAHGGPGKLASLAPAVRAYLVDGLPAHEEAPPRGLDGLARRWLPGWARCRPTERVLGSALLAFAATTLVLVVVAAVWAPLRLAAGFAVSGTCVALVAWIAVAARGSAADRQRWCVDLPLALDADELRARLADALAALGPAVRPARVRVGRTVDDERSALVLTAESVPVLDDEDLPPWNVATLTSTAGAVLLVAGGWFLVRATGPVSAACAVFGAWVGHTVLFAARSSLCTFRFRSDVLRIEIARDPADLPGTLPRSLSRVDLRGDRVFSASRPPLVRSLLSANARHAPPAAAWRAPRVLTESASDPRFAVDFADAVHDLLASLGEADRAPPRPRRRVRLGGRAEADDLPVHGSRPASLERGTPGFS